MGSLLLSWLRRFLDSGSTNRGNNTPAVARDGGELTQCTETKPIVLAYILSYGFGLISMMFFLKESEAPLVFCSFFGAMLLFPINAYCSAKSRKVRLLLSLFPALFAWFAPLLVWIDETSASPEKVLHNPFSRFYFFALLGFILTQAIALFLQPEIESLFSRTLRGGKAALYERTVVGTLFLCGVFAAYCLGVISLEQSSFLQDGNTGGIKVFFLSTGIVMNVVMGIVNSITWNKAKPDNKNFPNWTGALMRIFRS
jgi:hypothetical protein